MRIYKINNYKLNNMGWIGGRGRGGRGWAQPNSDLTNFFYSKPPFFKISEFFDITFYFCYSTNSIFSKFWYNFYLFNFRKILLLLKFILIYFIISI